MANTMFFHLFLASWVAAAAGAPGAVGSIGAMMGRLPVQMVPDTSSSDSAVGIIKGLARIPAPTRTFTEKIDPVVPGVDSCDRDYDDVCPEGWVNIGAVKGGSTEYCHGGTQYFGPCSDEVQSFSSMSTNAKKRWSAACQAFFPCKSCSRDFGQTCPEGWAQVGNTRKCKPEAAYKGICRGAVNFEGYNNAMLESWSEACGAYWKCQ